MITQNKLEIFCKTLLKIDTVSDSWCKNGLQVPGKREIKKIALGTTASKNFLQMAKDWEADAVIVHHGLFWGKGTQLLNAEITARLKILLQNNISLLAYHIPLDAHPEIGNNAQIAKRLELSDIKMADICTTGKLKNPILFTDFKEKCEKIFGQKVNFAKDFLQKTVSHIGICSGGGSDFVHHCKSKGVDTFITGEVSEQHFHTFSEMPINFLACGHHATERFGVQALGEKIQKEFPNIQTSYFTEECPV